MFDNHKKKKLDKLKTERNRISDVYRDKVLNNLDRDKPVLLTNRNHVSILNTDEVVFNKYGLNTTIGYETEWFKKMKENIQCKTGGIFILNGNINDQAIPKWNVEDYIKGMLVESLNIKNICTLDYVYMNECENTYQRYKIQNNFTERLSTIVEMLKDKSIDEITEPRVLIIKHPEFVLTEDNNTNNRVANAIIYLYSLMDNEHFRKSNNTVIILTENKSVLQKQLLSTTCDTVAIDIPFPSIDERKNMIRYLDEKSGGLLNSEEDVVSIANATAGLNLNHIEKIWKKSLKSGRLSNDAIKEYKREVMKKEYEGKIDIVEPSKVHTLENYGGMDYIKEFLRKGVIKPILKGETDMIPKGMLFMGSPGTGKSYMAKCLASEAGVCFAELKVSKFISKWVGETEQGLEKALLCVKSLAPCFLFIDEIDQVFQRWDDDFNGVRSNMFQMMMSFIGDPDIRGKVILIGATNYPNKIDEALKRAGRFDIRLVFTPPLNADDTKSVLKTQLNSINYPIAIEEYSNEFKDIVCKLQGYSQAEIELVVKKALSLAKREEAPTITYDIILKSLRYIKVADNKKIDEMIELAVKECNDLEFLSEELVKKYHDSNIIKMNWDD